MFIYSACSKLTDPNLDDSFHAMEGTKGTEATEDPLDFALQADYIPLDAGDIMKWNYLDADDDADTGLF
jgi:hypothetical protein